MSILNALTKSEKIVIALVISGALIGIAYSAYKKHHAEDISRYGASLSVSARAGGKVNVNTATTEELMAVKGIGPVLAGSIIEYRQANGPFSDIQELDKVKGIGPKKLISIKENLTLE